jgi:hypothetical protein
MAGFTLAVLWGSSSWKAQFHGVMQWLKVYLCDIFAQSMWSGEVSGLKRESTQLSHREVVIR